MPPVADTVLGDTHRHVVIARDSNGDQVVVGPVASYARARDDIAMTLLDQGLEIIAVVPYFSWAQAKDAIKKAPARLAPRMPTTARPCPPMHGVIDVHLPEGAWS